MNRRFSARTLYPLLVVCCLSPGTLADDEKTPSGDRTAEYAELVARGAGFVSWQERGASEAETVFRATMEARKDEMLAQRVQVAHPVLLTRDDIAEIRRKVEDVTWARDWFARELKVARHVADQPPGYVRRMIPELTPANPYGMTCPSCVGMKSQEGVGSRGFAWRYRDPEVIRCRSCDQAYPSSANPETATLVCPRSEQQFTYYRNEAEREHSDDRTGKYAYHWVGYPVHMSFTGILRHEKVRFMTDAAESLALAYAVTGEPGFAERTVEILTRLAHCYRGWLYHDYWGTIADCDPLYAAWHWSSLPLEYKRHLCTDAYKGDTVASARMLQSYWGAGRVHPSTDSVSSLRQLALAYDLVHDARSREGRPLWSEEARALVERDLLMEQLMGAEPFVGGRGEAQNVSNKSPRVYVSMAAVARCLGLTEWAETALRGYEAVRDHSFEYDGFSHETPAYNNMYLAKLAWIPELLHGFDGLSERKRGTAPPASINLYESDARLRLMYRALIDQVLPNGAYLPLGDSQVAARPARLLFEIGRYRYPDLFKGSLPRLYSGRKPSEYAIAHLSAADVALDDAARSPEVFFPRWMTAILRHGQGPRASTLALSFSPPGGHRHRDNLTLLYVDRGRRILGDHGYVGDMPVNAWIRDTRSHNLVVVDGRQQQFSERIPRLRMMVTSPQVSVVEASSKAYPQCTAYRRLVALVKGPGAETFAVDIFRVKGGAQHAYRSYSELAASDARDGAFTLRGLTMPLEPPLPQVGHSLERTDIFGLRDRRGVDAVPARFEATWKEQGNAYRAWILTRAHRVEAANGPGQQSRGQAGRRVRYLDLIRKGKDLSSTYVVVHEPTASQGGFPIRRVERLTVPEAAGPQAVAVKIDSIWGSYWFLSEFSGEAEVDGIRFQGDFGFLHEGPRGERRLLTVGSGMLDAGSLKYSNVPARWGGPVVESTSTLIRSQVSKPTGFPDPPPECTVYALIHDGSHDTGLPVAQVSADSITVERFPVPDLRHFELPAVRLMTAER